MGLGVWSVRHQEKVNAELKRELGRVKQSLAEREEQVETGSRELEVYKRSAEAMSGTYAEVVEELEKMQSQDEQALVSRSGKLKDMKSRMALASKQITHDIFYAQSPFKLKAK